MKAKIIALCIVLWAIGAFGKSVTVEGSGYTRDGAIRAALRSAVEQVVGVRIGSETLVKNATLISDEIISQAQGYVSSYELLAEKTQFGLVTVRLRAEVSLGAIEDTLAAHKMLYAFQNSPRIMVVLDERSGEVPLFEKTATYRFEQALLAKGFVVVQPHAASHPATAGDGDLAGAAFSQGADLLVRGSVQVGSPTSKMIYGVLFQTVPVQINARIVRADNEQVIAVRTGLFKKNSRETESAAQLGLQEGGSALANALIVDLLEYWRGATFNENRLELIVTDLPPAQLDTLEETFRRFGFVRKARLKFIEGNRAAYELDIRGTVQELRAALENVRPLGLSIVSLTAGRIVLRRGEAPAQIAFTHESADIDITAFSIDDLFPSRIRRYETEPVGRLTVAAGDRHSPALTASILIADIMKLPAESRIEALGPRETRELPFVLLLDASKTLEITQARTVYGKVKMRFRGADGEEERTLTAPVTVHDRNAMDWREPASIGGFVTFRDPLIDRLARTVVADTDVALDVNRDLLNGIALFEAMRALELRYIKDPVLTGPLVLDHVQYPRETIANRGGDCDDLSVLYAALLGAVGTEAAIISYADHVLVMFNTGVYEKNRHSLSADTMRTIRHRGTLWIPVETTMLSGGFVEAWHAAAAQFHKALGLGERVSIIDLGEAWKEFPPAPLPAAPATVPTVSAAARVGEQLGRVRQSAADDVSRALDGIKVRIAASGRQDTLEQVLLWNRAGVLKARHGDPSGALAAFIKALEITQAPGLQNNYACALLIAGKEDEAQRLFDSLYAKDRSGRTAVNRALCLYIRASTPAENEQFIVALQEAVTMIPGGGEVLSAYLGLNLGIDELTRASDEYRTQQEKEINLRRLREIVRTRVLATQLSEDGVEHGTTGETSTGREFSGTTTETSTGQTADTSPPLVVPFGGIRGADPEQVGKIIDLLYWFEEF